MTSTVNYDSAVIVPAFEAAADDSITLPVDTLCMRGYAAISVSRRLRTGNAWTLWSWQKIGNSPASGKIVDEGLANTGGLDFYFGHGAVLSTTGPTFFVPYLSFDGTVPCLLSGVVLNDQTVVGRSVTIDANTAAGVVTCACTSTTTGYIAYSNLTDGVVLIKSTNLNTATPTWSARKVIQASGQVVRGSLISVSGVLYVMVLNSTTITAYKSTNDGTSWSSLGVVTSTAQAGLSPTASGSNPIACMKSGSLWSVLYYQSASGIRLACSRDGGATWTDNLVNAATPTGISLYMVHASHVLAGWTTLGTTLPAYAESTDSGSTWTTPTVIGGGPGAPSASNNNVGISKITHGAPATGGLDGGIMDGTGSLSAVTEIEFSVLTFQPSGSPTEASFISTGGWSIQETTNDPDSTANSTSTKAEGAGLFLQAMVSPGNAEGPSFQVTTRVGASAGEGAALQIRATVAASNGEGAACHVRATVAASNGEGAGLHIRATGSASNGEGAGLTIRASTSPANAEGAGDTITAHVLTQAYQLGFAVIKVVTGQAQLGYAMIRVTRTRDQAGYATVKITSSAAQTGYAFIRRGLIRLSVTRTVLAGWRFTWEETNAPYTVWLDGQAIAVVTSPSFTFEVAGFDWESAPPDIEVVDPLGASSSETYQPYVILQWRGMLAAWGYAVEQFLSGVWTRVATIGEVGQGYYSWQSGPLDDETTQAFRVRTTDLDGNTDAPIDFSFSVARNPRHPNVAIAGSGSAITVS